MVVNRHSPAWIGVSLSYVSVLPSCPLSFLPQHLTVPFSRSAQENSLLYSLFKLTMEALVTPLESWQSESVDAFHWHVVATTAAWKTVTPSFCWLHAVSSVALHAPLSEPPESLHVPGADSH